MSEKQAVVDAQRLERALAERQSASTLNWMSELGKATEGFARAMRTPTERRPFVYELRFDLVPGKRAGGLLVLKGFGSEGPVCMFQDGNGFLSQLRGAAGQLRSGSDKWRVDDYAPGNYDQRVARYLAGEFYVV